MKKVKFIGTVETFYFVPNSETETAVLYLKVTSEQQLPDGKPKVFMPAEQMRFMLSKQEMGIWAQANTITQGDCVTIYIDENSHGELSYRMGLVEHKTPVIDAKEYVRQQSERMKD